MTEITPTRSIFLELKQEQQSLKEAYSFLDEKRTILAAEILKLLKQYGQLKKDFLEIYQKAMQTLKHAISYYGIDALFCADQADISKTNFSYHINSLLGVKIVESQWEHKNTIFKEQDQEIIYQVQRLFHDMLSLMVSLTTMHNNLYRLYIEYKQTERRSRALEDVLLPELDSTLRELDDQLEALDLEEAIRVRSKKKD